MERTFSKGSLCEITTLTTHTVPVVVLDMGPKTGTGKGRKVKTTTTVGKSRQKPKTRGGSNAVSHTVPGRPWTDEDDRILAGLWQSEAHL